MDQPIQIKRNALDVIETIVSLCCLVGVAAYLFFAWRTIPDQVPTHFNAAGEIDSMGGKRSLLLVPIVSWLLYGLMTLVERFPQVWNTGVFITENNRDAVYRLLKNMMAMVKMFVMILFASLTLISAQSRNLPIWYVLAFLAILFSTIAYFMARLLRLKDKSIDE
jgi:uncharacterized membrane protein